MSIYVVTGKLGAGKTLVAVSRIREYLQMKRRVATNIDLDLQKMGRLPSGTVVNRLPDFPSADDLWGLGRGHERARYNERRNGLIVIDECARLFNSREWNADGRKPLLNYFLHARKQRWDVILLVQDVDMLDKQLRGLLCEHLVICKRFDRLLLLQLPLPRVHVGLVYYGETANSVLVERWWYRGNALFDAYDTQQAFGTRTEGTLYEYTVPEVMPWPGIGTVVAWLAVHVVAWSRFTSAEAIAQKWGVLRAGPGS